MGQQYGKWRLRGLIIPKPLSRIDPTFKFKYGAVGAGHERYVYLAVLVRVWSSWSLCQPWVYKLLQRSPSCLRAASWFLLDDCFCVSWCQSQGGVMVSPEPLLFLESEVTSGLGQWLRISYCLWRFGRGTLKTDTKMPQFILLFASDLQGDERGQLPPGCR